jgi:hypothetical protein
VLVAAPEHCLWGLGPISSHFAPLAADCTFVKKRLSRENHAIF